MLTRENVVLHVADVHKNFGGLHALSDIDLQVEEGKTHAIIGPNGAGKSTLLNVIIGRLPPSSGAVVFDGIVLTGKKPHEINQLGVARVFQTPEIFADLSILQNVMTPAFARRDGAFKINMFRAVDNEKEIRQEAEAMLEDVGLIDRREGHAGALSRGDKRRLELAMCLIQKPRLLLLDEPTAGMSRHDTNTTIELLKKIKARGMTKVIIEHDMHVVFSLADRVTVLAQGRIIAAGSPDEVRGNPVVQEAYLGGAHL
ncbi:MAG: ABC transporter ATP-binding protein [Rhizobiaceae bacterium]|nr:ABC transporter ATP-binding protein [Rhizobiaceae bacterium]